MTDTPETDELRDDIWQSVYIEGQDFIQMLEHARKLERERDEARESLEFQRKLNVELNERAKRDLQNMTEQQDKLTEALQEMQYDRSDKAIKMANELLKSLTNNQND